MTKIKKVLTNIVLVVLAVLVLVLIVINITPIPLLLAARKTLAPVATYPKNYNSFLGKVNAKTDEVYKSEFEDNTFDVYQPKNMDKSKIYPAIIWVHGGAFVGGDKKDLENYAVILASKGYVVFSINYELAPGALYPTPIVQLGEFYKHLVENQKKYNADISQLFFAGDSAGAQIAAQFLNIQTNQSYAKEVEISPLIRNPKTIKGVLLYCGPYEAIDLMNSDKKSMRFMFNQIGWGYFGRKDWMIFKEAIQTSILKNVSKDFPNTYITDGNTGSFETQGKALVEKLKSLNVPVTSRFFEEKNVQTPHEYQFKLDTKEGQQALDDTLLFLEENLKE